MLTHYFDLKAIPQSDLIETAVVGYIMEQIHLALPEYGGRIGVGFPLYGRYRTLGGIVRVFGTLNDLEAFRQKLWKQQDLSDYALFGNVQAIPGNVRRHAVFKRMRPTGLSDINRSKTRWRKQGLPEKEIEQRLKNWLNKSTKPSPYIFLNSRSTYQRMVLYIAKTETMQEQSGTFSSYGLSTETTVPLF